MENQQIQIPGTTIAEVDFSFRANRETKIKRDTVSLEIPVPNADTIVSIIQDTSEGNRKTRTMVLDAVQSLVVQYVRGKVNADEEFDQETLNGMVEDLTLTKLANLPSSRRSSASKDELEDFAKDYIEYMPQLTGISKKAAETAGNLFVNRVKDVLGNPAALQKLHARVSEFLDNAPEEVSSRHVDAITYLLGRMDEALGINYDPDAL